MGKLAAILILFSCMVRVGFSQVKPADSKKPASDPNYRRAIDLAPGKPDSALYYYLQYRKTVPANDSLALKRDINFYNYTGSVYTWSYFSDSTLHRQDLKKALTSLEKVLDIDSTNLNANLNVMLLYYNIGVNHIVQGDYCKQRELKKNTDWNKPDSEIPSLAKLLECIRPEEYEKYHITPPFRSALPYALRVHRRDPDNKKALEALQGIYVTLGDEKQSGVYKAKFEKLQKK